MKIALTGGTGFIGSRLIDLAVGEGHSLNALTRRSQREREGVTWIDGSLEDRPAVAMLVDGADALIHLAGVLKAKDAAGFEAGNVQGTLAMLAAATARGVPRFVHVSSLAAREPRLSLYGGSKARSEALVESSGLDWAIVRPPAVYGPGDRETLELFKMAKLGVILMPPNGRLSIVHADDLARLLLALAAPTAPSQILIEPDDGSPEAWTHKAFGAALGAAVGKRPLVVPVPAPLLRLAARTDVLLRRSEAKLTPDRAAYFAHRDWTVDAACGSPPTLWRPRIPTPRGLADTAAWYRAAGWL